MFKTQTLFNTMSKKKKAAVPSLFAAEAPKDWTPIPVVQSTKVKVVELPPAPPPESAWTVRNIGLNAVFEGRSRKFKSFSDYIKNSNSI